MVKGRVGEAGVNRILHRKILVQNIVYNGNEKGFPILGNIPFPFFYE